MTKIHVNVTIDYQLLQEVRDRKIKLSSVLNDLLAGYLNQSTTGDKKKLWEIEERLKKSNEEISRLLGQKERIREAIQQDEKELQKRMEKKEILILEE